MFRSVFRRKTRMMVLIW